MSISFRIPLRIEPSAIDHFGNCSYTGDRQLSESPCGSNPLQYHFGNCSYTGDRQLSESPCGSNPLQSTLVTAHTQETGSFQNPLADRTLCNAPPPCAYVAGPCNFQNPLADRTLCNTTLVTAHTQETGSFQNPLADRTLCNLSATMISQAT
jgi:hypothetical protein